MFINTQFTWELAITSYISDYVNMYDYDTQPL